MAQQFVVEVDGDIEVPDTLKEVPKFNINWKRDPHDFPGLNRIIDQIQQMVTLDTHENPNVLNVNVRYGDGGVYSFVSVADHIRRCVNLCTNVQFAAPQNDLNYGYFPSDLGKVVQRYEYAAQSDHELQVRLRAGDRLRKVTAETLTRFSPKLKLGELANKRIFFEEYLYFYRQYLIRKVQRKQNSEQRNEDLNNKIPYFVGKFCENSSDINPNLPLNLYRVAEYFNELAAERFLRLPIPLLETLYFSEKTIIKIDAWKDVDQYLKADFTLVGLKTTPFSFETVMKENDRLRDFQNKGVSLPVVMTLPIQMVAREKKESKIPMIGYVPETSIERDIYYEFFSQDLVTYGFDELYAIKKAS